MRLDQFAFNGDLASQIFGAIEHDTGLLKDRQASRVGNVVIDQDLTPQFEPRTPRVAGGSGVVPCRQTSNGIGFWAAISRKKLPQSWLLPNGN
jgi:hypothetical protein